MQPMQAKLSVNASFFLYCALLMLLLPLRWVLAAMAAAVIHECFHILAIKLCRVELLQVTVGAFGANLHTGTMTYQQELICALAGPVGSLSILILRTHFPVIAFCCAVQAAFNMLPLYPADGGRAVRCILLLLLPSHRAEKYIYTLERILRVGIILLCLYGVCVLKLNISVLLAVMVFCFGKFPCNTSKFKVQ